MHNKTGFVLGCALLCFVNAACSKVVGSGKLASELRAVEGVHAVELAGVGNLTIIQGDKEELVVEAEDNLLPLIESNVGSDGSLVLRFKENDIRPTKDVAFKLTVPHMDQITLSGSGRITSDHLSADHARIRLPGSGDIRVAQLDAGELAVTLEGSGKVSLGGGSARRQAVDLTGSGSYDARAFKTDAAAVSISGSGEAKVNAQESLDVNISGSGEVSYSGNPKLTKHISGSGEVRQR